MNTESLFIYNGKFMTALRETADKSKVFVYELYGTSQGAIELHFVALMPKSRLQDAQAIGRFCNPTKEAIVGGVITKKFSGISTLKYTATL